MDADLVSLILDCARDVAELEDRPLPDALEADAPLFGENAVFDSVGLVSLVVAVEQAIEDVHDVVVSLADQRAMSQERSPFRRVASLAAYAAERVAEARGAHA